MYTFVIYMIRFMSKKEKTTPPPPAHTHKKYKKISLKLVD